jgi:hypothetical protein
VDEGMVTLRDDGFVEPCIPTLAAKPPIKHDGYRLIVRRDERSTLSCGLLPNVLDCLAQALGVDMLHFLPGFPSFARLGRIPPLSQFRTPLSFHFVGLIQVPNPPLTVEVATAGS